MPAANAAEARIARRDGRFAWPTETAAGVEFSAVIVGSGGRRLLRAVSLRPASRVAGGAFEDGLVHGCMIATSNE